MTFEDKLGNKISIKKVDTDIKVKVNGKTSDIIRVFVNNFEDEKIRNFMLLLVSSSDDVFWKVYRALILEEKLKDISLFKNIVFTYLWYEEGYYISNTNNIIFDGKVDLNLVYVTSIDCKEELINKYKHKRIGEDKFNISKRDIDLIIKRYKFKPIISKT